MGSFHIGCGFYGVCHGVLMATILLFALFFWIFTFMCALSTYTYDSRCCSYERRDDVKQEEQDYVDNMWVCCNILMHSD